MIYITFFIKKISLYSTIIGKKRDISKAKYIKVSLLYNQDWSQEEIARFLDILRYSIRLTIKKVRSDHEISFKSVRQPRRKILIYRQNNYLIYFYFI